MKPTIQASDEEQQVKRRLILNSFQSPGDIVMLSAAVRDLHAAYPGQFQTDIRTSADAIWENNPYITQLNECDIEVASFDMHYPAIHQSNQRPYHFIHGYPQYLEQQLDLRIPVTKFHGDIHLSEAEKASPPAFENTKLPDRFWIVIAGGKYDFTAKWWNPTSYQAVVNHFQDRLNFVQCGEGGHWHPRLNNVVDLVGKTSLREFIRLMYHADGVLCPVTLAMHLAAAIESKSASDHTRPCVVVAGGREPAHWEAYPNHQYISTTGTLECCANGGCWKSRCQLVGDGDSKDRRDLCESPVQINDELRIPKCMDMITPEDVIRRIELYHAGDLHHDTKHHSQRKEAEMTTTFTSPGSAGIDSAARSNTDTDHQQRVLIHFRHGLGDAVQLTAVLRHLRHYHPSWTIDVAALPGKHSAFVGLCNEIVPNKETSVSEDGYDRVFDLDWEECATCFSNWPSSKVERCLIEVFDLVPIPDLCRYEMHPRDDAFATAKRYLRQVCRVEAGEDGRFPVVLIHYQGNTSAEYKNLSHDTARMICDKVIKSGSVPIILDWDNRSPLPDGKQIHNPHVDLDIWGGIGTGDAEVLAALIELSTLMIGVDSGPLHTAGATSTPTLAVWTKHHPLHYFGLSNNITHLVPEKHEDLLRGDRAVGTNYFESHYKYRPYDDLANELSEAIDAHLQDQEGGLVYTRNFWIRSNNTNQDLVVVQDIAENDSYRISELPMPEPVIVDVGAHIGCFSKAMHARNPLARIFAIECCPENVAALRKNVGGFATVVQGAMTYEEDVALLNAVFPDCVTTGGSCVVSKTQLQSSQGKSGIGLDPKDSATSQYWADSRPLMTVTIEQIVEQHNIDRIDVLKLDCEGSEFSILDKSTSLERVDRIVGEYHGKERFHELVKRKFADWKLRILKDGELGTFWLENPSCDSPRPKHKPSPPSRRCATGCGMQQNSPWIYLCTPQHTGTHFLRLLLELHPQISFWKCGRTVVEGRSLGDWHKSHLKGEISFRELLRLGVRCEPDLPEWTRQEVGKLGLRIPPKRIEYDLVQKHALHTVPWYPSMPTVVAVRDPLLAIISGLRRKGPVVADAIVAGVTFLAAKHGECFMFCVDQWRDHRERALELLTYLDLEPTQEIYDYIARWPSPNSSESHEHLVLNDSPELAVARRLALDNRQVHPVVKPWAQRLRQAGLQEFYESLGYSELAWFE